MLNTTKNFISTVLNWFAKVWKMLALFIGSSILLMLIGLVVLIATFSGSADDFSQTSLSKKVIYSGSKDEIALVRLTGEIISAVDDSFWGYNPFAINPRNIQQLTSQLSELDDVKAVVLVINSPGGSVSASEEIYQQLRLVNQVKPVYAYFEEMAASGGYYIALPSRKIFASIPTITGSIGVIAYDLDLSGLMQKTGVQLETYQSGPLKDLGSFTRLASEQEQAVFESVVADSFDLFIDRIEESRDLSRADILELADGRIYSGKQAKENGLIDELGTIDDALRAVALEIEIDQPTVVEYSLDSGFWSGFLGASVKTIIPNSVFPAQLLNQRTGVYFF